NFNPPPPPPPQVTDGSKKRAVRGLVLVPTKELSEQVSKAIKDLTFYLSGIITFVNLASADVAASAVKPLLLEKPDVLIGTPSKILSQIEAGSVDLKESLETLIIDEADLILSYGHDEDVRTILNHLPQIHQSLLMSATVSSDVQQLKQLVLRNPAILKLEDEGSAEDLLTQYYMNCGESDKFLITFFLLKLKVFPFGTGKTIVFVNDTDRCYKLKLFLEQFGIKSCALNAELPLKSRYHIVEEFNRGVYDIIIATDESQEADEDNEGDDDDDSDDDEDQEGDDEEAENENEVEEQEEEDANGEEEEKAAAEEDGAQSTEAKEETKSRKRRWVGNEKGSDKKKSKFSKDSEYGVSRGVDFRKVQAVINFDLPQSSRSYMHRVGRTARGVGNKGWSLSFVVPRDKAPALIIPKGKKIEDLDASKIPIGVFDDIVFDKIVKKQEGLGRKLLEFTCDMAQVNAFKYRVDDAMKSITKTAVKESRLKEIKQEILNSEKLKAHFEDNPKDLQALRHDKPMHQARVQHHMKHVPDYLMPKQAATSSTSVGHVPFRMDSKRRGGRGRGRGGSSSSMGRKPGKKSDPLKVFKKK
ncbi:ATP-dependent DNA/RNA helicase, partial [Phlyctochytrium planicorne]